MKFYGMLGFSILVGVIVNLILPFALKPIATDDEIKPPNGAENLSFKGQIMHMFVHHAQVPLTSSIIVAIIVTVSILGGKLFTDLLIKDK